MVKWVVGDSVDYEVNGTWYPGYIARSDSSTLYFKYEATKFKSYEEPIKKADRDDLARLRAGSGSGPPAAVKKKKPAAKKSYELGVRGARSSHRWRRPVPDAGPRRSRRASLRLNRPRKRRPCRSPRPRSLPRSRSSPRPPPRLAAAPREAPTQAREETDRYEEVARQEEVARPQEKEVAVLRTVYLRAKTT